MGYIKNTMYTDRHIVAQAQGFHIFFMDIVRNELMSRYFMASCPLGYSLLIVNYISAFDLPCSSFSLLPPHQISSDFFTT